MRLLKFSFEVIYVKGTELMMLILCQELLIPSQLSLMQMQLMMPHFIYTISCLTITNIFSKTHTNRKTKPFCSKHCNNHEWPSTWKDCPIKLWRFWIHHDDLTKINVILKGSRIDIPPLLQLDILQCILEGPYWEEKCKWRAQKVLFWPQMNKNVKAMWQKCKTCSKYAPSKPKELMILHEVPTYPWQKLGTDLFKLIKVIWLLQIIIHYGQMFTCLHACK